MFCHQSCSVYIFLCHYSLCGLSKVYFIVLVSVSIRILLSGLVHRRMLPSISTPTSGRCHWSCTFRCVLWHVIVLLIASYYCSGHSLLTAGWQSTLSHWITTMMIPPILNPGILLGVYHVLVDAVYCTSHCIVWFLSAALAELQHQPHHVASACNDQAHVQRNLEALSSWACPDLCTQS